MAREKEGNAFLDFDGRYSKLTAKQLARLKKELARSGAKSASKLSSKKEGVKIRIKGIELIPVFSVIAQKYSDSKDARMRAYSRAAAMAASQLQKVANGGSKADLRAYKRAIQANPDISITKSLVLVEPDEMSADMFIRKVKGWDALMAKELGL